MTMLTHHHDDREGCEAFHDGLVHRSELAGVEDPAPNVVQSPFQK
jgi:hypothetical protein